MTLALPGRRPVSSVVSVGLAMVAAALPAMLSDRRSVLVLAIIVAIGLSIDRPTWASAIGALTLTAELALACGHGHSLGKCLVAAACGLLIVMLSGHDVTRPFAQVDKHVSAARAVGLVLVVLLTSWAPVLGSFVIVAGLVASATLLVIVNNHSARLASTMDRHRTTHQGD